jgi:hypothetical protein
MKKKFYQNKQYDQALISNYQTITLTVDLENNLDLFKF